MNDKSISRVEPHLSAFSRDKVDLIKRTVAKNATDDELKLFLHQCERTGLDPLARQIYFRKQQTKNGPQVTIITGIDGYRLIAERTGNYAGNDDPVFDNEEEVRKATVTVYKIVGGIRCGFTASARWSQYYPGDAQGFMWQKMPHLMLGKCAEGLALRKAFPAELSGIYVKEEMDQARETGETSEAAEGEAKESEVIDSRGIPFDPENTQHKKWLWGLLKQKYSEDDAKKILPMMKGKYEDELDSVLDKFLIDKVSL